MALARGGRTELHCAMLRRIVPAFLLAVWNAGPLPGFLGLPTPYDCIVFAEVKAPPGC